MRPRIQTNCWLCMISGVALVVSILSSPIRPHQTANACVTPSILLRNITLGSTPSEAALTQATLDRASIDADRSDFDEEDEDESFWSFCHLVRPTFIPSDSPLKLLSRPLLGNFPPRTVAVPIRC